MANNNLYYGIVLYIIIVSILVLTKPSFIYNKQTNKYKEFGNSEDKTLFTLPVISIMSAVFIAIVMIMLSNNSNNSSNKHNLNSQIGSALQQSQHPQQPNVQYVPMQYFQPMSYSVMTNHPQQV